MTITSTHDAIDAIAGTEAAALRRSRPVALHHLAEVHDALFAPAHGDYGFTAADRGIVALFVAALHRDNAAIAYYGSLLTGHGVAAEVEDAVLALAEESSVEGPYGRYPAGFAAAGESTPGPVLDLPTSSVFGFRLGRALSYAHLLLLHPRDGGAEHLQALREGGWTGDQIVILTQIVAALSFQLRVAVGARALVGAPPHDDGHARPRRVARSGSASPDAGTRGGAPTAFTDRVIAWRPWIEAPTHDPHADFDWAGVFGKRRASSPSFRLSARDPYISLPLSRLEDDIFGDGAAGLGRAERELGALTVSRENGCVYCASVHSRAAEKFSGRSEDVRALLDDGPRVDVGVDWNVYTEAALALTATPVAFTPATATALVAQAGSVESSLDFVHSVGYFNFANRIMLALGDPVLA